MKIKSYKKIKNNCYQISFSSNHEDVILFADIILKYNLLLKKEIDEKELQKIMKENFQMSCYYKALQYISKKNRSKKEISAYLKKENFKEEDIVTSIRLLEEKKIIDEEACLEAFVHDQVALKLFGPKKIIQKGVELGFLEERLEQCLDTIPALVWKEKLEHLITKKLNANHKDSSFRIKEKIVFSCMQEGYSKEEIIELLSGMEFSKDQEFLQREANKMFKKLSRNYQGTELFYQLKRKLLQKGFVSSDIASVIEELKNS